MVFPYDKRPYDRRRRGGRGERQVPMHVAEQIAEQRDRFMAEVQKLRRENDRLEGVARAAQAEKKALERRVAEAERSVRALRDELASQTQLAERKQAEQSQAEQKEAEQKAAEQSQVEQKEAEQKEAEIVSRLTERIETLQSDLDRVRQRTAKAVSQAQRDERIRLLSGLGNVLDSIDRALDMGASGPWREGMVAIRTQLLGFLRAEGAELLGEVGESMDPRLHEAVDVVDSDEVDANHIVSVERHGLMLEDGTVARPARVVVAR